MLTPQVWQMGLGLLSLREAVEVGHGWPLVKMQLEPPVQAAGEHHPAGLPRGENRRARGQDPLPRAAPGAQLLTGGTHLRALVKGGFPLGVRGAGILQF